MGPKIIFDSNIWIAHFNTKDSTAERADALFQKYVGSEIIVPDFVVAEVVSVLKRLKKPKSAMLFLDLLENNQDTTILLTNFYFKDFVRVQRMYEQTNLSFYDVALVVLSAEYQVMTFDKALLKALV